MNMKMKIIIMNKKEVIIINNCLKLRIYCNLIDCILNKILFTVLIKSSIFPQASFIINLPAHFIIVDQGLIFMGEVKKEDILEIIFFSKKVKIRSS